MTWRASLFLPLMAVLCALTIETPVAAADTFAGCDAKPSSELIVSVKDKGAKGDGKADDTGKIQRAIDEVAGTGGTVYVPDGVYMVRTIGKRRLRLGSNMTLRLSDSAVFKAIPNGAKTYSLLRLDDVTNVAIMGGTLQGDRSEHKGKSGEGGMGIRIGEGVNRVAIVGVTARDMWGDGFYVQGASDIAFCEVTALHNRRQGLSIIDVRRLLVTGSLFQDTRGTRPSAGIDLEPDRPEQKIVDVRIKDSKFVNNAGGGIMIAGKRGEVANVEIILNVFEERRPILVENAPAVRSTSICDNRHIGQQVPSPEGLNAYADAVEVVSLQDDCRRGRDLRFEVTRQTKKKRPQSSN